VPACGKKGDPTLKAYEKPDAPSGLKAIHRESEIIISWEFPKTNERIIKGFHVMKSFDGDFQKVASLEKDKRFYIDNDFSEGIEYEYKIISENLRGITNSAVLPNVKPLSPPPAPPDVTFTIAHDTLILRWSPSNPTSLYNIYKSGRKGEYGLTPVNIQPLSEASFQDSFDINRTVYYTVRSLSGSPIRDEGPPSAEIEINPLEFIPSPPRDLIAVPAFDRIYLIWREPPETWVAGYRVYREMREQEGYVLIGSTQTPSFLDEGKISSKRNYLVTALGPAKEGPPAEIREVAYEPEK